MKMRAMGQRLGKYSQPGSARASRAAVDAPSTAFCAPPRKDARRASRTTSQSNVTEAARNFADCVNRAHYQNVTFVLLKNGSPVARLVPDREKVCNGSTLADALAKSELPEAEAAVWHHDLQTARKTLKPPAHKWR